MNYTALFIGFIALALLAICCLYPRKEHGINRNPEVKALSKVVGPTKLLTPFERKMYSYIKSSIPSNYSIMCQVSFNAFLKCDDIGTRNKFNRMSLDFMIIDENFIPVLCVELDDRSHNSLDAQVKDGFRDNLLSAAHIPTERFNGLPKNKNEVKKRLKKYFSHHTRSKVYKTLIKTK